MLRQLHISGLGVIDDLELELGPGLTVLTGETGAGKTMVTVGLMLALGERGSSSLLREGAPAARVQARFDAPPEARDWAEDGEVILARSIARDGRSTARIGGQLTTAAALAELGSALVEHHAQDRSQRLLAPAAQAAFLDRFAGDAHVVALAAHGAMFERRSAVRGELEALEDAARGRERELDLLAYQVREIEAAAPHAGESEELAAEEGRLGQVERLLEQSGAADAALVGEEQGPVDAAASVAAALAATADLDPSAEGLAERARGLAAELAELARDVRSYQEGLLVDPDRLQTVRERIAALRQLQRKYGSTDADVLAYRDDAAAKVSALEGADERLAELADEMRSLDAAVADRAGIVTAGRRAATGRLADAVRAELEELGMPGASFEVRLVPLDEPGANGAERVELWFSPSAGQPLHPLAKTASGGERSRVLLACRSVLADLDDVGTLVFDEVDAGIGGAAGLAVGRRLARLAAGRQILVVTHLPQIACFAERHVRVSKEGGSATSTVLDDRERTEELSRMLAGLAGTRSAVSHAEELLAEAERLRLEPTAGARG